MFVKLEKRSHFPSFPDSGSDRSFPDSGSDRGLLGATRNRVWGDNCGITTDIW
ncbi:MAG: hypothetical protein AB4352_27665 [Hormoscilla sp.]